MFVCCVLSGRGLCDKLITRPEESCRLWCVVCDLETSRMRRPWPALGRSATKKKCKIDSWIWGAFSVVILQMSRAACSAVVIWLVYNPVIRFPFSCGFFSGLQARSYRIARTEYAKQTGRQAHYIALVFRPNENSALYSGAFARTKIRENVFHWCEPRRSRSAYQFWPR